MPSSIGARRSIKWRYTLPIICIHMIAALAFLPYFFSWTGVVLAVAGWVLFGVVGLNVGYHRLLTHRSFSCPRWLERTLAVLGVCCMEESPTVWVAWHRKHHHFADQEKDPHSPIASFFWGHIGWLLTESDDNSSEPLESRYAPDLVKDPFYAWLEASDNWYKIALASWVALFVAGYLVTILADGSAASAIQFGASLVVWAGAVRTVLVWHSTWSVNSVTHLWGYRNYDTPDNSRNNFLIGLLAGGEGWHNNHHAAPTSARHGHKWWEIDLAWVTICFLMKLGLITNVALPPEDLSDVHAARAKAQND